ncbi:LuxR C-terminal-related transcriptional regulator [Bradyrhizobium sp. DASA03076]|uniref:LuxR C-terminal-related transcriptional regulator n=1 Tax=Bradyrhizobium sp. BLXBL-03 TaxID=3395916 RepID=UPI003F70B186
MPQMLPIRLVIADRRPIVLQGFGSLFAAERDFEIVASCINGADCLDALRRLTPDVVLVEDGFSDVTAAEMLAVANAENLATRLVFYTASVARGDLAAAIEAGACSAIPMREEPETLIQSLRLVAPTLGRAAASKPRNGALGENGLAALTDQDRKIMRLVASGMPNKDIARRLKVAPGAIKARLDRISAQLDIKSRTELASFALSRLFGGIGALAALIWAALDDARDASAAAIDHTDTDSVTVTAADGTSAVVTIKIATQKTAPAPGKAVKALGKVGRIDHSVAGTPTTAGRPIESRADSVAGAIALPTLTSSRPGLSSAGAFLMTAVGVLIYEFLHSPAQAFKVGDGPNDLLASAAASGSSEMAALNSPGTVDPALSGFDNLAWLAPETHQDSFLFAAAQSDGSGRHDEIQTVDATWREDGADGNATPHIGAGAVDALIEQSGLAQAAAANPSMRAEHDIMRATAAEGPDREPAQRDLHVSEQGAAAGKPHAEQESRGHNVNHGKSQADVQASEDGAAAEKQHGKHDQAGHTSSPGPSHRDLHASEHGSAAAGNHVADDGPGSHLKSAQSQHDVHETHANACKNPHAAPGQDAGSNGHATYASGPAQTTAAPQRGDSFHFKNDMAEAKPSDHFKSGHGPDTIGYAPHDVEIDALAQMHHADPIGASHAEPGALDHARGIEHHFTHDLVV